jgi:N-acetylglucosaminyldiphosphoundecaprenol N-acetyl-beta-D-mannosaminyltransferase
VSAPELDLAAPHREVRLGELWVNALTFREALDAIEALVSAGAGGAVFTPNVDHVVLAEDDLAFRRAYEDADLRLADGQPLVWASRLLGTPLPEKVSGSDLVWPLVERAARRKWRVYLLGGAPGAALAAASRFREELGAAVAGVDDVHIDLGSADGGVELAAARVREARPDLLLVGLGAPKQELWIHRSLAAIRPAVAVAVGASLDFIAGRARRAPRWMSRAGLEWLHRLAHDPRRLARRYLLRDPRFLAVLARTAATPRALRSR